MWGKKKNIYSTILPYCLNLIQQLADHMQIIRVPNQNRKDKITLSNITSFSKYYIRVNKTHSNNGIAIIRHTHTQKRQNVEYGFKAIGFKIYICVNRRC